MDNIPNRSNFFGSLDTHLSRRRIAGLYRRLGWKVRKCGWSEPEIRSPFAELIIEADSPILIHGSVANVIAYAEAILAPLRQAGVSYTAECYGDDGALLSEFQSIVEESNVARDRQTEET